MSQALVLYESMFGNTRAVAEVIAAGIAATVAVDLVEVGKAPAVLGADVELLVVGGPTHAFSMSRRSTRRSAAEQTDGPLVSQGIGIREWLASIRLDPPRLRVATFDTKIRRPRLPGSAARGAARRLRRRGALLVTSPETFYVVGTKGPLLAGELERARAWGKQLAAALGDRAQAVAAH